MSAPKLRIIAGPNGSGKSTVLEFLRENFSLSFDFYLNADEVEKSLKATSRIDFQDWGIRIEEPALRVFLNSHPLASRFSNEAVQVSGDSLIAPPAAIGGYFSATICDFVRKQWLMSGQSFTFETVMSGRDKLELMRMAKTAGYRTYFYFVCTDDPEINRRRVAFRVSEGGHDVPSAKITSR